MDGRGQCATRRAKRGCGEKKALGKAAFGRHKGLLVLPPECLLYSGPFSLFSLPQPFCKPSSSLTWTCSQPLNWSPCLHPLLLQTLVYSAGATVILLPSLAIPSDLFSFSLSTYARAIRRVLLLPTPCLTPSPTPSTPARWLSQCFRTCALASAHADSNLTCLFFLFLVNWSFGAQPQALLKPPRMMQFPLLCCYSL